MDVNLQSLLEAQFFFGSAGMEYIFVVYIKFIEHNINWCVCQVNFLFGSIRFRYTSIGINNNTFFARHPICLALQGNKIRSHGVQ